MIRQNILFALLMLTLSSPAFSDPREHEQPLQEVFQSDLVYAQERGELQLTFSPEYDDGDEFQQWIFPITVEYGLTDAFQIELEWSALVYHDPDNEDASAGIGDLSIGALYSWMDLGGLPLHAAAALELGIPTGDENKELGEGDYTVEPTLVLAWDLPIRSNTQVFINVGAEISESEEEAFVNLGFFTAIGNTVLTAEWNWSEEERYFTPGLVWHPCEDWEIGLGVPIGLNSAADNTRVIFKFTYER